MPFDFHQWLDDAEDLSLPQLVKATEREAIEAERRAHRGRGIEVARRAGAQLLARQLGQLLYFLRYCDKPATVRPEDWVAYRPVAERLVAVGQWQTEVLKLFDRP